MGERDNDEGTPAKLRLDDVELVPEQTSDDTDDGWGSPRREGSAATLRRYLDEKPPHHGD